VNVFVLDYDPDVAAAYLVDKHVVKMMLETAQLLSTAVNLAGVDAPYKTTHANHPCSLWVRESRQNFDWLVRHGIAIAGEYTRRYGKVHKSESIVRVLSAYSELFPDTSLTAFALAMPEEYKTSDAVESYRKYYTCAKRHIASWKTSRPPWFV
jgi:hypothetical protein